MCISTYRSSESDSMHLHRYLYFIDMNYHSLFIVHSI